MADIFDGFPIVEDGVIVGQVRDDSGGCGDGIPPPDDGEADDDIPADLGGEGIPPQAMPGLAEGGDSDGEGIPPPPPAVSLCDSLRSHALVPPTKSQISGVTEPLAREALVEGGEDLAGGGVDGADEELSGAEGDVILADDAEVLRDFPDSSLDIDILPVHKRFIDFYLTCGNKTKAAKLAGIKAKNDATLRVQAVKVFKRAEVQAYYKLKKAELDKLCDITFDAFMSELVAIGTLDIRDVCETESVTTLTNENAYIMRFKRIEDMPEAARKAVKAIEIAKDGTPKMVFYDKLTALKLIGEIKGYVAGDIDDEEGGSGVALMPAVLPHQ